MEIKAALIFKELGSMLYWSMLAACTVGPGTVVTCSRAGAEYGFSLIWALIFASILAYTLQEGTARLTIVSGKSLGTCLRLKYRHGPKILDTAIIGWMVTISVFFGNTLYECNNWAGGIDAAFAFPENNWPYITPSVGWRVGFCIFYGIIVLALLFWDKVDSLGMVLGFIMMGMVILFLVVVSFMDIDGKQLGWGFIPSIPAKGGNDAAEPTDIILSLVGTTSLGFNLFLGGSMAQGKQLGSAQRGIAFSTCSALAVSVLILIVGAETFSKDGSQKFTVDVLAGLISRYIGEVGVYIFAIGFIAAAVSSMLAVPLGAALTAESVFAQTEEELEPRTQTVGAENPGFETQETTAGEDVAQPPPATQQDITVNIEETPTLKSLPRFAYWTIMTSMVLIAVVVISANAPRVGVILIAQVFNGCLLPFFSICLLLCLNDDEFMNKSPQKGWSNIFMFVSVSITLFLTSNVLIQKILGSVITNVSARLGISLGVAIVVMICLTVFTSLGKGLHRSFSTWKKSWCFATKNSANISS